MSNKTDKTDVLAGYTFPYGCYSVEQFKEIVNSYLKTAGSNEYMLVSFDIDNFKYINDLFGYETGDQVINALHNFFSVYYNNTYFAYLGADNFMFFRSYLNNPDVEEQFKGFDNIRNHLCALLPQYYSLVFSVGILRINTPGDALDSLFDKANYARKHAKGNHHNSFAYYDDKMDQEIQNKKEVTISMQSALQNNEFRLYLQPKVLMKSGRFIGLEALARWNSPKYGFLLPAKFIPIFEQNGFIKLLDFYILEQVCSFLKGQLTDGRIPPLPVAVNFSRAHVDTPELAKKILGIVTKYNVPPELIEIEFTETVLLKDLQHIVQIASELRSMGFTIAIDDFGSEYSSLSCLKDLPVDVVKIDKSFLLGNEKSEKTLLIIERIVELLKSLRLITVIEGVETAEQSEALRKFGCDIGQGYYYAKPMSVEDYNRFAENNLQAFECDAFYPQFLDNSSEFASYSQAIPKELEFDNWELYTLTQNIDIGLIKGCIDSDMTVQYINKRALEYLGYTRKEFAQMFSDKITSYIHPDDEEDFKIIVQTIIETGIPSNFTLRAVKKDGTIICLQGRISCVTDAYSRHIGIFAFQDVTEDLKNQKILNQMREKYKGLIEQSNSIIFEWDPETDTVEISPQYQKLTGLAPMGERLTLNEDLQNRVHPDDLPLLKKWLALASKKPVNETLEFRLSTTYGNYIWVKSLSTAIFDESGNPIKTIGTLSNISVQKNTIDHFRMKSQLDSLTKLYNKSHTEDLIEEYLSRSENDNAALLLMDIDNFKEVNDILGHQFGDKVLQEVAQKINNVFLDSDIIGRIGGDEFAVMLEHLTDVENTTLKIEKLLDSIRNIYFGESVQYEISVSIGLAYYPAHGKTFDELYKCADHALYEAKRLGKNRYIVYCDTITTDFYGQQMSAKTTFDDTERFLTSYFESDFIYSIFGMLYETTNIKITVNKILELVGNRFDVDRVYIFEQSDDCKYLSNTYEWCREGIPPVTGLLQNIELDRLHEFFSLYNSEGMLALSDVSVTDEFAQSLLEVQNIKAVLQCGISNEGEMKGIIGFADCNKNRLWRGEEIAILGYISKILSIFILKKQISKELWNSYQNYTEMLDNLNGYVYVIDLNTFEMLYTNNAMKVFDLVPGQKCHEFAFGSATPCENCPARQLNDEVHFATEEIYSSVINTWVSSAASTLKWTDGKKAALICCTDITKYKHDCIAHGESSGTAGQTPSQK